MPYQCACCGQWHEERPTCFGAPLPAAVAQLTEQQRASRVQLSSDQCVLDDEHFFILGNLDLSVRRSDEVIRWAVWSTVSRANFERASELWSTEGREVEQPYFGYLSNSIPGYPGTINIKLMVHTQPIGIRPVLQVIDEDHALRHDQDSGISAQRADELIHVALYGAAPAE